MLEYITRDGSSPNGKQRVFFCALPENTGALLQDISRDIFAYCHCAIWYDDGENTPPDALEEAIAASALAVLPVTADLFAPDSPIRLAVLPAVFRHSVPVLPILEDPKLMDPFNAHFRNMQLLDRYHADETALPYREKLARFLEDNLLRDELVRQVKAAFSSRVFLSYRKADRQLARGLMRSVQMDPACRGIAFWYDEFLTPGEDFDENIRKAIHESDLFLLSLTENMLRAGNYVIREEYPYASRTGKEILPVELEPVDPRTAADRFPGLPEIVELSRLRQRLAALGHTETTPERDYLLGQAYLMGLYQERNAELAVEMFEKSAAGGYAPAALRLSGLFLESDTPAQREEKKLRWLNRYAQLCQENFYRADSMEAVRAYADAMERLAEALCEQRRFDEGFAMFENACKLLKMARMGPEYAQICSNYGAALVRGGRHRDGLEAIYQALQCHIALGREDPEYNSAHRAQIAYCCFNGAYAAIKAEELTLGAGLSKTAVRNFQVLARESPEDYTIILAQAYDNYALIQRKLWEKTGNGEDLKDAEALHYCALQVLEPMLDRKPEVYRPAYAQSCGALAAVCMRSGDLEQALAAAESAIGIFREMEAGYPGRYLRDLAGTLVNRASVYFELRQLRQALADYREAEAIFRQIPGCELDLALALWNAGNIHAMEKRLPEACEHYRQAMELYCHSEVEDATRSVSYAQCCQNYANALYQSGLYRYALVMVEEALGVYQKLAGESAGAYGAQIGNLDRFAARLRDLLKKE